MGKPLLTYNLDRQREHVRLILAGELDISVGEQLQDALAEAAAQRPRVLIVDLSAVQFIDSHSIGILVRAYTAAQAAGYQFTVANPRGIVLHVLDMMGLLDILTGQPSTDPDRT